MAETRKDDSPQAKKPEVKIIGNEILNNGVLKKKDQEDLENRITDTLKNLNSKLTKKQIIELLSKIEVSKGLDGLKEELGKNEILGGTEISDDVLKNIMDLIQESREIASKNIEELKLELSKINISKEYSIDQKAYITNKFPWIKKLEDSELGKNIIIDLAGITVGAIDSVTAVFKFLLGLIKDIFLLPKDLINSTKSKGK
ncbi:MAG: hypothetical protein PHF26_02100 [Candidatus Gracilibacteria bacterium]|nr:hypothetical protein [Candidatus Gracilibacteria bacterium]